MVDEGVPTGFRVESQARYHAFRGLALRSAQRCGRRCLRDPPDGRRAGKPQRTGGLQGWGNFSEKKKRLGFPLKKPSRKK